MQTQLWNRTALAQRDPNPRPSHPTHSTRRRSEGISALWEVSEPSSGEAQALYKSKFLEFCGLRINVKVLFVLYRALWTEKVPPQCRKSDDSRRVGVGGARALAVNSQPEGEKPCTGTSGLYYFELIHFPAPQLLM